MVTMSAPLNLWAPSSAQLLSDRSPLKAKRFLELVDKRNIRIFAREHWLTDPDREQKVGWEGAAWNPQVDGRIKKWAEDDATKDFLARRVVVAPPEPGWGRADEYIDEHPREIQVWAHRLRDRKLSRRIPAGTRQAALRAPNDKEASKRILRDAFNHGAAFDESLSKGLFVLTPTYMHFLRLLSKSPGRRIDTAAPAAPGAQVDIAKLSSEMLEILKEMESLRRHQRDPFAHVGKKTHKLLTKWMAELHEALSLRSGRVVNGAVLQYLLHQMGENKFHRGWQSFGPTPAEAGLGALGALFAVEGALSGGLDNLSSVAGISGIGGITVSTLSMTAGMLRVLGFVSPEYDGSRWPFYYAFNSAGTPRQREELLQLLRLLHERSGWR